MTKSYTVKNGTTNDGTMSIRWGAGVYNTPQYDEFALPNGVKIQPGDTTYVKSIKADLYGYINSDVYANGVKVTGVEGEPSVNGNSKMLTFTINSNNWYIIGNTAAHDQCFYSIEFSIGEGSSPTDKPVTGVSLNKNTLTLEAGRSETLSATINPTDATNKNVTWSSNNATIATVNSSGVVSALTAGNVTITVTTEDGSFTDTCEVTVTAKTITPDGNGGCGGSIAITSGLIAALSAVGIATILIKKKKYSK